ncbi:MAG TPA: hypothetical protein VEI02_13655 [Planctomycetota bacterium]|nr:hypothetical protein [Planctomycetota bacterium]
MKPKACQRSGRAVVVAVAAALSSVSLRAQVPAPGLEWTPDYRSEFAYYPKAAIEFDDGSGPALFVGGLEWRLDGQKMTTFARRRNGAWMPAGVAPKPGSQCQAFAVWDDGTGPALYAAGRFYLAVNGAWHTLAKWDGTDWTLLGGDNSGDVYTLTTADVGGATRLMAGGRFTTIGGVGGCSGVAAWDGVGWIPCGAGLAPSSPQWAEFRDFAVATLAGTTRLYACGIKLYGGPNAEVCWWDGSTWTQTSTPVLEHMAWGPYFGNGTTANALCAYDDGGGEALYLGGRFAAINGVYVGPLLRYDGTTWSVPTAGAIASAVPSAHPEVTGLAIRPTAAGPQLVVKGRFDLAGGAVGPGIATLTPSGFTPLTPAAPGSPATPAGGHGDVIAYAEDGSSRILGFDVKPWPTTLAIGAFQMATHDGIRWRRVDERSAPFPYLWFDVVPVAGGTHLYGAVLNAVVAKVGANWVEVAALPPQLYGPEVKRIVSFDAGGGPELFLIGRVFPAGTLVFTQAAVRVAGGQIWPTGAGGLWTTGSPSAAETIDLGAGPRLIVAGGGLSGAPSPSFAVGVFGRRAMGRVRLDAVGSADHAGAGRVGGVRRRPGTRTLRRRRLRGRRRVGGVSGAMERNLGDGRRRAQRRRDGAPRVRRRRRARALRGRGVHLGGRRGLLGNREMGWRDMVRRRDGIAAGRQDAGGVRRRARRGADALCRR